MNRKLAAAATLLLLAGGLSACGGSAPIPQAGQPAAVTAAAPVADTTAPVAVATATPCDVVKEALLTGTPTSIKAAMKGLVADKASPATAREYASYYVVRDAGQKDLQKMDESLIQMGCS
jgi:hypothetical protein